MSEYPDQRRNSTAKFAKAVVGIGDNNQENPKPEIRNPKEIRIPKCEKTLQNAHGFSDFGIRISNFRVTSPAASHRRVSSPMPTRCRRAGALDTLYSVRSGSCDL